ncbi:hypothetical protein ACN47E_009702 [Coniothyrium glycines]
MAAEQPNTTPITKRPRGRPRKYPCPGPQNGSQANPTLQGSASTLLVPKRKRGRPRKNPLPTTNAGGEKSGGEDIDTSQWTYAHSLPLSGLRRPTQREPAIGAFSARTNSDGDQKCHTRYFVHGEATTINLSHRSNEKCLSESAGSTDTPKDLPLTHPSLPHASTTRLIKDIPDTRRFPSDIKHNRQDRRVQVHVGRRTAQARSFPGSLLKQDGTLRYAELDGAPMFSAHACGLDDEGYDSLDAAVAEYEDVVEKDWV